MQLVGPVPDEELVHNKRAVVEVLQWLPCVVRERVSHPLDKELLLSLSKKCVNCKCQLNVHPFWWQISDLIVRLVPSL